MPRWREVLTWIVVPFLLTRLLLVIAGFVALNQLKSREFTVWEIGPAGGMQSVALHPPSAALSDRGHVVINMFSRWDAEWYLGLARHGYQFTPGHGLHSNTAFFPLYPALMSVAGRLFGQHDVSLLYGGFLISNVSLLVGLVFLVALARMDFDDETARRSALYLLVFPTTLFFTAVYTESLFLAAVVASFYFARRGQWIFAGLAGAAATLTRPPGVLIFAALLVEYLHQRQFRFREIRKDVFALALVPAALCLHFTYLYWKFGSFWMFLKTEKDWGRPLVGAKAGASSFGHFAGGDAFIAIFALVLIAIGWRKLRPSYGVFATLGFLMPLASGKLLGMGRFCAILFPIYLMLGCFGRNATFDRYWLITSSALAVLFMALFSQWRYVG